MDFIIKGGNDGAKITIENRVEKNFTLTFDVRVILLCSEVPERVNVSFRLPVVDVYSTWSPSIGFNRRLGPDWGKRATYSRLASWMPVHSLVSIDGRNRLTIALSDAKTPTAIATGVCEEDACIECEVSLFTQKIAPLKEYVVTVLVDKRDVAFYKSVNDVVSWWENDCRYTPAVVPEHAKLPMNSLWYSYHQQLDVDDIVKECVLSKELGMETVIVDDGWQTDDNNRGYKYCGDWEVAPAKIPDIKQFTDRIHQTGMKIMLWFSVPFVGKYTKAYERFSNMLLDQTGNNLDYWSLDPRYKKVRDYLVGVYAKAVREWGFDGLKLDFIDSFVLQGKSLEEDPARDYYSLEDAVDALMTEVADTLRSINKDVLIEFRQSYVGPAIRKYGNMLRVGDCPCDAVCNRKEIIDLRLTSGTTAVHSDMLMWSRQDTVESAALQFVSSLYGVPQISVKLDGLSESHKRMLGFYLNFWRNNKKVLLDGDFSVKCPESIYSQAVATLNGKAIVTSYVDTVIDCDVADKVVAVNASPSKTLIIKNAEGKKYSVINCLGETVSEGEITCKLQEIAVPLSGMVVVG